MLGEMKILNGVYPQLDELRKDYDSLDEMLTYFAKNEIEKLPIESRVNDMIINYFP